MSKQDSTDHNVQLCTGVATVACRQPLACAMARETPCGNKPNQERALQSSCMIKSLVRTDLHNDLMHVFCCSSQRINDPTESSFLTAVRKVVPPPGNFSSNLSTEQNPSQLLNYKLQSSQRRKFSTQLQQGNKAQHPAAEEADLTVQGVLLEVIPSSFAHDRQ